MTNFKKLFSDKEYTCIAKLDSNGYPNKFYLVPNDSKVKSIHGNFDKGVFSTLEKHKITENEAIFLSLPFCKLENVDGRIRYALPHGFESIHNDSNKLAMTVEGKDQSKLIPLIAGKDIKSIKYLYNKFRKEDTLDVWYDRVNPILNDRYKLDRMSLLKKIRVMNEVYSVIKSVKTTGVSTPIRILTNLICKGYHADPSREKYVITSLDHDFVITKNSVLGATNCTQSAEDFVKKIWLEAYLNVIDDSQDQGPILRRKDSVIFFRDDLTYLGEYNNKNIVYFPKEYADDVDSVFLVEDKLKSINANLNNIYFDTSYSYAQAKKTLEKYDADIDILSYVDFVWEKKDNIK